MKRITKRIVLCADDYGQAEAVSHGIIDLIHASRLTAASCLVNGSDWLMHAGWLSACRNRAEVGLHLNLTQGRPVSDAYRTAYGERFSSLGRLYGRAVVGWLDQAVIEAEIQAQLDTFAAGIGCQPRYIDGHQHVHHFPVIRKALLAVYQRGQLGQQGVWIRSVRQPFAWTDVMRDPKKAAIALTGARALEKALLGPPRIPHNLSFSGIYSFREGGLYRPHFLRFLNEIDDKGIIMCHPGHRPVGSDDDPIGAARFIEYQYFMSDDFLADCEANKVTLLITGH